MPSVRSDPPVSFAMDGLDAAAPNQSRGWLAWLYGFLVLLFAWLMSNVPVMAIPEASYDDALFVRQAMNLLSGQWLGPYDNMTLAKGPFYPVWIAFSWILGLPILVSQGIAYALSGWLLTRGLRPWLRSEWGALAVFLILLLNPLTYSLGQLRVMREGIYVPLTLLIFALAIWAFRLRDRAMAPRLGLAAAFGVVLGMFWCTREEGVWILPALGLAAAAMALSRLTGESAGRRFWSRLRAAWTPLGRDALFVGATAAVAASLTLGVGWVNHLRYGVADVVEFKQTEFLSAYGGLSRIRHRQPWKPYVVIPRDTLEQAYGVSDAAAELRPYFSSLAPDGFSQVGCATYGVTPCDGEIRAGWFMWALRDAAALAGRYRTATEARAFYARLGAEIATACDDGRLSCLPPRATMIPPFRHDYIATAVRAAGDMTTMLATLSSATVPRQALSCLGDDCGQTPGWAAFLDMIRSDRFVHAPWLAASSFQGREDARSLWSLRLGDVVARGLEEVIQSYRTVLPVGLWSGLAAYALGWGMAIRRRRIEPLLVVATVCALLVAARIALLAYLEAAAIPSMNTLYLSPAFPALLLFIPASLLALVALFGRREETRAATD